MISGWIEGDSPKLVEVWMQVLGTVILWLALTWSPREDLVVEALG